MKNQDQLKQARIANLQKVNIEVEKVNIEVEKVKQAKEEKDRIKRAAGRGLENTEVLSVTMPDGTKINVGVNQTRRSSYERKGFVRVYKNMTPVNIQDALDKGFRAVIDKDSNGQVDRSGGQTISDGSLLRQLWMEIPEDKWKALKLAESRIRLQANKKHIKEHIYNKEARAAEASGEAFIKTEFESPNLGAGINLAELKEENLLENSKH